MVIMHVRKSLIVPVVAILTGILLQLNSLGIFGNTLPRDVLTKLWPLLIAAAALDLMFSQRRLIASAVLLFTAAALLCYQFLDGKQGTMVWQIFLKAWPILLVLFGMDCLFSERSLINTILIILVILAGVYALLTTLDIPALKNLPFELPSITSIIPVSDYVQPVPDRPLPPQNFPAPGRNEPAPQNTVSPIITGPNGQTVIPQTSHASVQLNLNAASGKISVKSGAAAGQFLNGTILLDGKEHLTPEASLNGPAAVYTLRSTGAASAPNTSNCDLSLSSQVSTALNAVLNSGYFKADLRGLDLSSVNIENKYGPIDVMMPMMTEAGIRISAGNGDIRVYIPRGVRISCVITGTNRVEYPQRNYVFSNSTLTPRSAMQAPIRMEIRSNNGSVRIIESE